MTLVVSEKYDVMAFGSLRDGLWLSCPSLIIYFVSMLGSHDLVKSLGLHVGAKSYMVVITARLKAFQINANLVNLVYS